jgi:hypothetical protein
VGDALEGGDHVFSLHEHGTLNLQIPANNY